jgi:hypothetical protein
MTDQTPARRDRVGVQAGSPKSLRSLAWFGPLDRDGFIHRSWMRRGRPDDAFDGRPVIGAAA